MTQVTANIQYDIEKVRADFPILSREVNGYPLAYFDNAATTQKPAQVIDQLTRYYSEFNSNIHRGAHTIADEATQAYEDSRKTMQDFIGAKSIAEVIFTSGVTESINLVADAYGRLLEAGDEILITGMEHHSNLVPWQLIAERRDLSLKVAEIRDDGSLDLEDFKAKLSERTKVVAVVYASNSLGTINPVRELVRLSHEAGAVVLVDAAQAAPHLTIDVQELECDFLALSGHKMYGPTGTGILYGKEALLEAMPPYQGGGEMISEVTFEKSSWNTLPYKFEAGTPNIAGVIALKAAADYILKLTREKIRAHEQDLLSYATRGLESLETAQIYAARQDKVSVISFNFESIHPFDVGMMLDARGVAVRTGHHCTEPLMNRYGIEGTVRASFGLYNTREEVDRFVDALKNVKKILGR